MVAVDVDSVLTEVAVVPLVVDCVVPDVVDSVGILVVDSVLRVVAVVPLVVDTVEPAILYIENY